MGAEKPVFGIEECRRHADCEGVDHLFHPIDAIIIGARAMNMAIVAGTRVVKLSSLAYRTGHYSAATKIMRLRMMESVSIGSWNY